MALLDRQGRLFGKFSILDIGAIATILIVLIGLLIVPSQNRRQSKDYYSQSTTRRSHHQKSRDLNPKSCCGKS